MDKLETSIYYHFKNRALLKQALMHRSATKNHNERLEFLGDGCLNFIIGYELYNIFPDAKEGELSNLRAHLVKESTLSEIAKSIKLNEYIVLSYGEKKNDGGLRPSMLADTFEAILAAIFLDSDFESVRKSILKLYRPYLDQITTASIDVVSEYVKDPKSRLQEKRQAENKSIPVYDVVNITGQDHEQIFEVSCTIQSHITYATGTSKKRAEQAAAELMLEKIS